MIRVWRKPQILPTAFRRTIGPADLAVGLGTLALLYAVARVGGESMVRFHPPDVIPVVSLDPVNLPNYAARSTLRMFIALILSTLFTFVYGYAGRAGFDFVGGDTVDAGVERQSLGPGERKGGRAALLWQPVPLRPGPIRKPKTSKSFLSAWTCD